MKYNELQLDSHKSPKRVGRGISGGQGKTAGRGTKGQKSRTGSGRRPGFEGGQNPLIQRLPKLRGFTSHRLSVENVYTGQLNNLGVNIDNLTLANAGLVENPYLPVKLIVRGELTKKVNIKLQSASAGAVKFVEKNGGSFTAVARVGREATKDKSPAVTK